MIPLKAKNVVKKHHDEESRAKWLKIIEGNINEQLDSGYQLADCHDMVGLLLTVYIRKELTASIRLIEHDSVKQGFANQFGNKGAVIIRMQVENTEISFVNVHLSAGENKSQLRADAL